MSIILARLITTLLILTASPVLLAQTDLDIVTVTDNNDVGQIYTLSIQVLLLTAVDGNLGLIASRFVNNGIFHQDYYCPGNT